MGKFGRIGVATIALAMLAVGVVLGTAMAERSATAPPIVYSGQILDATGAPITGASHTVGLSLWSTMAGTDTTGRLCDMAPAPTPTTGGHFSLALSTGSTGCANVFQTEETVWVQLTVDGMPIARTRAGAVPYAVTAERTVLHGPLGSTTTGGTYCGVTPPMLGGVSSGALVGYEAVHAHCVTACGDSPTAHLCSLAEWENALAIGGPRPWAGVTAGRLAGATGFSDAGGRRSNECAGWNGSADIFVSAAWTFDPGFGQGYPGMAPCDQSLPFLCCD